MKEVASSNSNHMNLYKKPFVNIALQPIIWQAFVAAPLCGLAAMVCGGGDTPTGTDTTDLAQRKIETGIISSRYNTIPCTFT